MKVTAVLENVASAGGGFNQSLTAVKQLKRLTEDQNITINLITTKKENLLLKEHLNIDVLYHRLTIFDYINSYLSISELGRRFQKKLNFSSCFEKKLILNNSDLIYFLNPSFLVFALRKLNYVYTIWDASHRDNPEFPEVRNNIGLTRDYLYPKAIAQSILTITDSDDLSVKLERRYGCDRNKLLTMPFASPIDISKEELRKIEKFDTIFDRYFYFPAQYWAHKNHIRVLEAISILKKKGHIENIIFTGSDKGNLPFLKKRVEELDIKNQVLFLDFLQFNQIISIYQQCQGVIMTSYFGYTNLPPLEAWYMKKPLIYNKYLGSSFKNSAILIDPDDADSVANAIIKISRDKELRDSLILAGEEELNTIIFRIKNAEDKFLSYLKTFQKRLSTWK